MRIIFTQVLGLMALFATPAIAHEHYQCKDQSGGDHAMFLTFDDTGENVWCGLSHVGGRILQSGTLKLYGRGNQVLGFSGKLTSQTTETEYVEIEVDDVMVQAGGVPTGLVTTDRINYHCELMPDDWDSGEKSLNFMN